MINLRFNIERRSEAVMAVLQEDMHLFFPPQWSPFQPFLSTPSLRAYLESRSFKIGQTDLNVGFYEHFIAPQRLQTARRRLHSYVEKLSDADEHYRAKCVLALAYLSDYDSLHEKTGALRDLDTLEAVELFYERIQAFEKLLEAFSTAEPVISIGHSSFEAGDIVNSTASIIEFVDSRSANPFLPYFDGVVAALTHPPRYFGVSIIGSEQVLPGLTLCSVLKRNFPDVPVVVGGSVFSRLVEKTATAAVLLEKYIDFVCRYEGERPMAAFLASPNPRSGEVPNLAYLEDGQIRLTDLVEPVEINDLPTPDFSGLPLRSYFAPDLVLPLLSTRGCYWGKCAFCYHGMIYQDRYRMRNPALIADDLATLSHRFGARHYAFNDEALPPKLFRLLPEALPSDTYYFTGLYKFEKIFKREYYEGMFKAGFRSLYIGLESASERVQKHMRKNNKQATMIDNLQFGHDAGIWNHTFNFFGFPTETDEEADETIDFLLSHANIIHSEGTGTFSFEHNAPISLDPGRFGVTKATTAKGDLSLYCDYEVSSGLDARGAEAALDRFTKRRDEAGLYRAGGWIPREYLLLLLSHHRRDDLRERVVDIETQSPYGVAAASLFAMEAATPTGPKFYVANKKAATVSETNRDAVLAVNMLSSRATVSALTAIVPAFKEIFPHTRDVAPAHGRAMPNYIGAS